jgi:hypothetical protein
VQSNSVDEKASPMNIETDELRILRLHKTWADRYTVIWQIFILVLFTGIYFLLEQFGAAATERADVLVLLAVMVLAAAVWQAVGLGIARVHMILKGIDLQARSKT